MKLLFVSSHYNPLNKPFNGDTQRTHLLLRACARFADVDVVTFAGEATNPVIFSDNVKLVHYNRIRIPKKTMTRSDKWSVLFSSFDMHRLFPLQHSWEQILDEIIASTQYDMIVSRYFPRTIACGLWKYRDKLVVDFDDALPFFFLNQIAPQSSWSTKTRMRIAARQAEHISRKAVRNLRAAFFAEENEANANKGVFLPNIPFYDDSCEDADLGAPTKRIVFVGQLDYQPNSEGLDRFLENIYLPLLQRVPSVEMHVVGKVVNPVLRKRWQSYPNVTVTGFVDDIKKEYAESHVAVVPVYRCGATNIKLLEAMRMNRACVTTKEAFKALNGHFANGRDVYAAATDHEFVDALFRLLTDSKENHSMAHNAKAIMDKYYSFGSFCQIVKDAIV